MRLEEALSLYVVQLDADGRSMHTVRQYQRHVRALSSWLGPEQEIEDITPETLARFLTSDLAKGRRGGGQKRATSLNALRTSLRVFFTWMNRAGHLDHDPARLVRRAQCGTPPPRGLSAEEQRRLLHTLEREDGDRDYALFALMLATGLRIGSALTLTMEDADLDQGELRLRRMKGDRPGRVFLGRAAVNHLRRYLKGRDSGLLFPTPNGSPMTTRHANRRLQMWMKRAGLKRKASPHSLRHSFGIALYEKTGDVLLVKEALGHRSVASTLVYARPDEETLRRALEI